MRLRLTRGIIGGKPLPENGHAVAFQRLPRLSSLSRPDYPEAVSGRGGWIYDGAGRAYLDASGGAAVSCLGHGDRRVTQAIRQQLDRLAYTHTSFFTTGVAEELADRLSAAAPGLPWRVLFVSGGSEATEAALKLARQI